jgi:hypothetical protein
MASTSLGSLGHADIRPPGPLGEVSYKTETEAIAAGEKLGVGSIKLEGPRSIEVDSYGTWTLVYTAGRAGIKPGGAIRIAMRHLQSLPQADDPKGRDYVTAAAQHGALVEISRPKVFSRHFAWQQVIQLTIPRQGLAPGQALRVTYGDRSGGGPGFRMPSRDESHFGFKVYVDALGDKNFLPLADFPTVEVVAAEPARLGVVIPSDAVAGEPTWCLVRAEDRFGNPAPRYGGTVTLQSTDPSAELPSEYTFTEADCGVRRFESIRLATPGNQTVIAIDGDFRESSNSVRVAGTRPERLLLWGDLHSHTLYSDGRGTVEQAYDFAERVAGLDFCSLADHAFEIVDSMWEHTKAVANRVNRPGRFVTFHGFEWSGNSSVGGDHNVYYFEDDPPIYRSDNYYDPHNTQMDHGPQQKLHHINDVFAKLREHPGQRTVFCIPHYGGRRGNPAFHDPKVQRLIEIFSEHRRSEDWATTFLAEGHRVGIIASGDGHYGNPGYGASFGATGSRPRGRGLVAVYAPEHTRKSIFQALYDRHCYATSGPRIILDVRADGQLMGSEYRTKSAPTIMVDVVGTAPVARVEIKKDGKVVFTQKPGKTALHFEWKDPDFQADRSRYYYVRIVQEDNEEAISSPIWVN